MCPSECVLFEAAETRAPGRHILELAKNKPLLGFEMKTTRILALTKHPDALLPSSMLDAF